MIYIKKNTGGAFTLRKNDAFKFACYTIATGEGALFWKRYKNAYKRITNQLKKIGKMMGLSIPLTTYVARHSWASAAKSKNVALSTISEGLGHDSEKTTRIYLSSLDTSVVDRANNLIIISL